MSEAPEWQTIETAPRNGVSFLGWNKTHGMHECRVPSGCAHYKRIEAVYGTRTARNGGAWFVPTHWMPLPNMPKGQDDE